ncbi:metal ABC transporter substrate-binding protein [Streptomyces sp. NPDC004726]
MNVRRLIRPATAAGAMALSLVAVSACSGSSAADGKEDGRLKVVASFYPMQFLAERIGGEHVAVSTLTKPGVEPHDLELKPRQTAELGEAGYLLYLKGIQPAVDKAVEQSGVKHRTDAATLAEALPHPADGGEGGARQDDHGDHDGHDHGDEAGDPHLWLDPVKYAEVAKGVSKALGKADPENADAYRKNGDALVAELGKLNTAYEQGLKNTATKTFITTHAAFGHLAERYGLDQESIAGVSPEAEPSPARIKELQSIAAKEKVTTVFFETLASDRTARTLAKDTGLKTAVLDPLEGITDKSKGRDYLEVMESNLAALQSALGAK